MSLKENEVIPYWEERAKKSGAAAVGFDAKNKMAQNARYHDRRIFLNAYLDKVGFTLDYGCGIGRYSDLFDPTRYLGADITMGLISLALKENPKHSYMHLSDPWISDWNLKIPAVTQIFTATVLQHNSDEVIQKIFDCFYEFIPNKAIRFVMYEKNVPGEEPKPHVQSLPTNKLAVMIQRAGYTVEDIFCNDHYIHNENHTLSIITTV